jgi:hypothetical protein
LIFGPQLNLEKTVKFSLNIADIGIRHVQETWLYNKENGRIWNNFRLHEFRHGSIMELIPELSKEQAQ